MNNKELSRILSLVLSLSLICSLITIPMTAQATTVTSDDSTDGIYYEQDFEGITSDFNTWKEANGYTVTDSQPFQIWGGSFAADEENNYMRSNSMDMYPLAVTPRTGIYELSFDFKPNAETFLYGSNWESVVMQFNLGSSNGESWHDMKIGTSMGTHQTGEVPIDRLWLFGNEMTIDPTKWINVSVVYDCENGTIEAKVTQGETSVTGNADFTNITTSLTGSPKLTFSGQTPNGTNRYEGVYFDNFVIENYVFEEDNPGEDDDDSEEEIFTGMYYEQDFEGITSDFDTWKTANAYTVTDSQPFQIWGGSFASDEENNYMRSNSMDMYPLAVTPRTGIYELSFDFKPNAETFLYGSNWESIVMQFNLGSSNSDSWHDMKIGTSWGANQTGEVPIDRLWLFGNEMTIDPTKWINVSVVYNCEAGTISAKATQGTASVAGSADFTNTTTSLTGSPKLTFSGQTPNGTNRYEGVYFDNFVIENYVFEEDNPGEDDDDSEEEIFTGMYYEQDFEGITSDFDTWKTANAYTVTDSQPFQIWGGSFAADEENNYMRSNSMDMYPLAVTPKTGKYELKFDIKPNEASFLYGSNWESIVMQFNLGSSNSDSWHDMKIGTSWGTNQTGEVPIDRLWLFGNEMTIDPTKWINVSVVYNCEAGTISAKATQGTASVAGSADFKNEATLTGSPKLTFSGQTPDGTNRYEGVYLDNFKISVVAEKTAPILGENNVNIYAGEDKQKFANASAFTDKIVIDFGQVMYGGDINDTNIYIVNKTTNNKVSYSGSYSDRVYTMAINDVLDGGSTYTLYIDALRNIGGVSTKAYAFDFNIKGGVFAELVCIKQNGSRIENLAELTAGDATIELKYSNSVEQNPKIYAIVAYYKNGEFVKSNYLKQAVDRDNPSINQSLSFTVPTINGGFDDVKVMFWDGFYTMNYLCSTTSPNAMENEISFDIRRNIEEGSIKIETTSVTDDFVSVQILPQNITPEQVEQNALLGESSAFCAVKETDENGKGAFSTKIVPGNYVVYVASSKTGGVLERTITITDSNTYSGLIDDLTDDSPEDFISKIEANKAVLGFDIELYSSESVQRYYSEYQNNLSGTDYDLNVSNFTKCALTESLNVKKDVDAAAYINKLFADDSELLTFISKHVNSDDANQLFTAHMSGKNIKDSAELLLTAKKAVILTAVKYPDGNMNIEKVLKAYNDEALGLPSISSKSSVYLKLAGNSYNSISEFLSAYNLALDEGGSLPQFGGTNSNKYVNSSVGGSIATSGVGNTVPNVGLSIKFEDLDNVTWAYMDIAQLYEKGIINGFTETEFRPDDSVKREQLVKMIIVALNMENESVDYCNFKDVPQGAWHEKYISIAKAIGMTTGMGNGLFGTGADVTRQDMAVMIYNAMLRNGFNPSGVKNNFADKDLFATYADEAIAELSAIGIINGVGDNYFNPQATATRAQAAVILNRALKYLD